MSIRGSGYPDDLAAKGFHQKAEFGFRVQNENIVIGGKCNADDFFLGREGFTGTGNTQAKAVAIEQLAAVCHNHVLGNSVLPIVDAAVLEDFLRPERNQHSGGFGGEGAQCLNFSQAVRENGVQPILLLPAQDAHLAQVFSRRSEQGFGVAVQLLLGVG